MDIFSKSRRRLILNNLSLIIKSFGPYSLSNLLAQFLGIIYSLTLANYFGPTKFGFFAGHLSFVLLTSFMINWGFDTYFLYRSGTLKTKRKIDVFNANLILSKILLGVPWTILLVVFSQFVNQSFFNITVLVILGIETISESIFITQLTALNIKKQTMILSLLLFLSRAVRLLSAILLIFFKSSTLTFFFLARLIISLLFTIIAIIFSKPKVENFSLSIMKTIWRSSTFFGLSETLALIYAEANISLLAVFLGSTETGLFSTSSKLVIGLFSVPNAIYKLIIPRIRLFFLYERKKLLNRFIKIQGGLLVLGIVLFMGLSIFGRWLVPIILSDSYKISGDILQILSITLIFKSLNFGFGAFIVAVGWQKFRLIPQLLISIISIFLNLIIIPRAGMFGAAYVFVLTEILIFVGYSILTIRWIGKNKLYI